MAYRWPLELDLDDRVSDHSMISRDQHRRFHRKNVFRHLFEHILHLYMKEGLVDGKVVLTDSTYVRASASFKMDTEMLTGRKTTDYMERLDRYGARLSYISPSPRDEPWSSG